MTTKQTREEWLNDLMTRLLPLLEEAAPGSTANADNWRVSVGWPGGGSRHKRIGECWSPKASTNGYSEIFISPKLATTEQVDHVLLHEMIHAADKNENGHKGPFRKIAVAVGLIGKMTATTAGDALRVKLDSITAGLGPYPHSALNPRNNGQKKQTTRMKKLECSDCGYVLRTTQSWIDIGLPSCCCGGEFRQA